jgi:hypothetical protein
MNPRNYNPPSPVGSFFDVWRAGPATALVREFGTPGQYTRAADPGVVIPLRGKWKAPFSSERLDGFGVPGVEGAAPALIFRTSELPGAEPAHGDKWSDGVVSWYVIEVRPNPPQGLTVLVLSLDPPG